MFAIVFQASFSRNSPRHVRGTMPSANAEANKEEEKIRIRDKLLPQFS
tara:strand:+ start:252 stop:395 length:144 start_codon:yes stop_codon:yes gene_type:complete